MSITSASAQVTINPVGNSPANEVLISGTVQIPDSLKEGSPSNDLSAIFTASISGKPKSESENGPSNASRSEPVNDPNNASQPKVKRKIVDEEEPINPKIVLEPASEDSGLYLSRTFYLNGESYEITKFDANGNLIAYDKNAWNEIEAAFKQDLVPIANNFTANVTKEAKFNLDSNQLLIEGKSDQAVECTLLKGACGRLETCDRLENRSKTVEYAAGKKPSPGSPFNHLLIKKVTGFTFDIDRVRGSDETGILKQKTADGEKFYRINARFKGNVLQDGTHPYSDSRLIGFQIRAKSLKVALEMIEAYGRQMEFEKRDDADFENIRTNFRNKTFEAVVKIDRNADRGKEAMITFFMQNHTRHGLDYAFGPKPGSNNHYGIKEMRVDQEHINIIKHKAKLRKISKKPNLPVNAKFILSEKDPQVI